MILLLRLDLLNSFEYAHYTHLSPSGQDHAKFHGYEKALRLGAIGRITQAAGVTGTEVQKLVSASRTLERKDGIEYYNLRGVEVEEYAVVCRDVGNPSMIMTDGVNVGDWLVF